MDTQLRGNYFTNLTNINLILNFNFHNLILGKTLAYVLPIIQQLKNNLITKVRCLIVLPVQELAAQVYKVMITYCKNTNLRVALITGASSMEIEQTNLVKKSNTIIYNI